jgi:glycine/D-amino acid oxidase-like deaminating enzyme
VRADICIVGAGIAGLSTAYLLGREGISVAVLDDGEIASGMTGLTTAHLANVIDDGYVEIERLHGEAGARLAARSHTAAIDRIEAIVERERIDCDFERVTGYLFQPPGARGISLRQELEAAQRAGVRDAEMVPRAPLQGFDTGACIAFPNQAQIHPLNYAAGLVHAILQNGGQVLIHTHADSIEAGFGGARRRGQAPGDVRCHRRRNQCADQRPRGHPHETGAVHDLRDRRARGARVRAAGALLGHARPLPLRAAPRRRRTRGADRRR